MPRPLCFMIMPYGRKTTQVETNKGPGKVDFNALWDRAYVPAIKALGYEPIRADQDTGTLILTQMLERLYFSDLVLADISIANGNVYYEVGIRHAAQKFGCVLLAADWSQPLFDIAQMRTLRYPLPEGEILPDTAAEIQKVLETSLPARLAALSPMYEIIKGYPSDVNLATTSTMQDYLRGLAELQGSIRAVRTMPASKRMTEAKRLVKAHGGFPIKPTVAIALARMLREAANTMEDWTFLLGFIGDLPKDLADTAEFREQRAFALSNLQQYHASIAELETLIELFGPTPERLGLLGGRFKRLIEFAESDAERAQLITSAINAYERGMALDLNEYYCSSNLPRLYRIRNAPGDQRRAQLVLSQVIMACERALGRGGTDEWLRPTLLAAAFDAADVEKAEELADTFDAVTTATYKVMAIIRDLENSVTQAADPECQRRLRDVLARIRRCLGPAALRPTDEAAGTASGPREGSRSGLLAAPLHDALEGR